MIEKINSMFSVSKEKPTLTPKETTMLNEQFPKLPQDYLDLVKEASNVHIYLLEGDRYFEP